MFSISLGFKKFNGLPTSVPPELPASPCASVFCPKRGTPSTTNSGLLLARTEFAPLMFTEIPPPGSPLA